MHFYGGPSVSIVFIQFAFPEIYQGTQEGTEIPVEYLEEVAVLPGSVMGADTENKEFMEEELRRNCEHFLPDPSEIASKDAIEAYRFLKFKLSTI